MPGCYPLPSKRPPDLRAGQPVHLEDPPYTMAKRTRGSSRPGQRRPLQRSSRPARPSTPEPAEAATPAARPSSLTADEEARAAELEAQIVAEERQAEQAQKRARDRQRSGEREPVVRSAVPLSVREAEEYAYVARDVRRIATIAFGLLAIMVGLWIALQVSGVGAI